MEVGSSECAKCAINKAEKSSCCARGGAWFKNCGDGGDTKFDHTWSEGIQACKGIGGSKSVKSLQGVMREVRVVSLPVNSDQSRSSTRRQVNIYRADGMFSTGNVDCDDYVELTKAVVCICVLFCDFTLRDVFG